MSRPKVFVTEPRNNVQIVEDEVRVVSVAVQGPPGADGDTLVYDHNAKPDDVHGMPVVPTGRIIRRSSNGWDVVEGTDGQFLLWDAALGSWEPGNTIKGLLVVDGANGSPYNVELQTPFGAGSSPIYLRFHQPSRWFGRIRGDNQWFRTVSGSTVEGSEDTLINFEAATIRAGGTTIGTGFDVLHLDNTPRRVVQCVRAFSGTTAETTANTFQSSLLSGNITPKYANSFIVVQIFARGEVAGDGVTATPERRMWVRIRNTTQNVEFAKALTGHQLEAASSGTGRANAAISLIGAQSPNTTAQQTYLLEFATISTATIARIQSGGAGSAGQMIIWEIAQ